MRFAILAFLVVTLGCGAAFAQATATNYGTSCGPVASGAIYPNGGTHKVDLTVDNALPFSHVIMVVGMNEYDVEIPGFPGCYLYTDWVFIQGHRVDEQGHFTYSRALPCDSYADPLFYMQYMEVTFGPRNELHVRSTNGVVYANVLP